MPAKTTRLIEDTDPDFTADAHWQVDGGEPGAAGSAPVDGDTIGTTVEPLAMLLNRPATGTYSINQNAAFDFGTGYFLNGATILNVDVSAGGVYLGQNVTGTITTSAIVNLDTGLAVTGLITVNSGGTLVIDTYTLTAAGGIVLAGTGKIDGSSASSVIDFTTITGTGTIDWGSGTLGILGRIEGTAITHTNCAAGNSYRHDTATNLNLGYEGSDTDALAITITANATLTRNLRCGALAANSGTLAAGTSPAYTIICASFTLGGATFTGSGAMTIKGDLIATSGTNSHTGIWTFGATANWNTTNTSSKAVTNLNLGGQAITVTGGSRVLALSGTGTLILNGQTVAWVPSGTNSWSFTGTVSGTGSISVGLGANASNSTPIVLPSTATFNSFSVPNDYTLALTALTCGPLNILSTTATKKWTLSCGALNAGAVVLGHGSQDYSGILDLSAGGTHRIASLAQGSANNLANALILGTARLIVTGTITGTTGARVMTVTTTGGRIDAKGTGRVTAVTATGKRLVVYRAVGVTAGKQLRGWNVDSCANVRHYPRRIIGARQGLMTP